MTEEAELIGQAKAGDARAFQHALLPHLTMLLTYSRAICGDYHEAQDVVQETALIAYRNLERFFAEADFATWLKAIARRQALAARRRLGRQLLVADDLLEAAHEPEARRGETPRQEALRQCLESLPSGSRALVQARYAEGRSLQEMATTTRTNPDTLRWRMYRVRRDLRNCVERRLRREV